MTLLLLTHLEFYGGWLRTELNKGRLNLLRDLKLFLPSFWGDGLSDVIDNASRKTGKVVYAFPELPTLVNTGVNLLH